MKSSLFFKLLSLSFSLAFGASAQDFRLGDISYDITADCTVDVSYGTMLNNPSNCIIIPETVSYRGNTYAVTGIRDTDFSGCGDLAIVTIPASVTVIDNFTIKSNSNISGIICLAQKPPKVDGMSFSASNYENTTLFVPKESLDAYKATLPWNSFSNIQPIKNSHLYGDVNGDGFVEIDDVSTLIDMLLNGVGDNVESDFPELDNNGLLSPNNSRVLPLESMGADYDNIDGGSFNYSPLEGDIFFRNNADKQIFVYTNGDTVGYSAKAGVLYINKHTLRMYSWNGTCMVELGNYYNKRSLINDIDCTDSEFSVFSVGQVGYSLDRKRFELKIGDDQWWYYLPDSTRIYCDASTNTLLRWNNNDESFVPVGGGKIEVVNDLTTGGEDKALSAEMGKRLGPLDVLITDVTHESDVDFVAGKYYKNYGMVNYIGSPYAGHDITDASDMACVKVTVSTGDIVTIWCSVPNTGIPYVICDSSNIIKSCSPKSNNSTPYTYTRENPAVLTITEDGYLYINAMTSAAYGCTISRAARELVMADNTHDGIMSKEYAATLETLVGQDNTDINILKSYLVDSEESENIDFVTGKYYKNFGMVNYIGSPYAGHDITDASDMACAKVTVRAGEIVTIWCSVPNTGIPYVICDSGNIIKTCSPKSNNSTPYTYTRENPAVLTITEDGYIYIDAMTSAAYGCIVSTPVRVFRNATSERDGLMPKEIMALFGGDNMSDEQASLKLKTFAFIGDSFSAGGYWQKTMCNDLGALFSINKAVSGGAWHGTDNLSAYYQAQQLVSSGMQFDYILCVLGTNDVAHWNSYTLGDINFTSQTIGTASGDINPSASITGGIQATLITLKRNFPNAIIKIGYTPAGLIHDAVSSHQNVNALCDRLRELSLIYGVGYLETRDCGICYWLDEDKEIYISGGHPTGAGQTRIGHYMARKMLSNL